jgi:3-oxoacyl-[acyl-carrier protein] reductase
MKSHSRLANFSNFVPKQPYMDLNIKGRLFLVTGASSGLGKGVAMNLLKEEARIIAVGRNSEKLEVLSADFPGQVEIITGDVFKSETIHRIAQTINGRYLSGMLVNAGGPTAGSFIETDLQEWDRAYLTILRWKIELTKSLLPIFRDQKYGRVVFIESVSVKQPVANLVLSNSLRMAVVGFVKTLSQELAGEGITFNIAAPGFHETPAAERLFIKRGQVENITVAEAKKKYESEISVGRMGNTDEFGMLCAWLLSPHSGYITGQTISIDGGMVKGALG